MQDTWAVRKVSRLLDRLEAVRPFTEREAWGLFRIAAFGEAVGWTLLISGLLIQHYNLPLHQYAVPIAGQIHGLLFLTYFAFLIAGYSSLRWPRKLFIAAVIVGVVPYGTLAFEIWVSHVQGLTSAKHFYCSTLLVKLVPEDLA